MQNTRLWKYSVRLYDHIILNHPFLLFAAVMLVTLFFAWHTPDFELDASADTLTLENDQALKYYRTIRARYGSDDFLIVTYSPNKDLFDPDVIDDMRELRGKLEALQQQVADLIAHGGAPGPATHDPRLPR